MAIRQLVLLFCSRELNVNEVLGETKSDILCEEADVLYHASSLLVILTDTDTTFSLFSHQVVLFVVLFNDELLEMVLCQELFL